MGENTIPGMEQMFPLSGVQETRMPGDGFTQSGVMPEIPGGGDPTAHQLSNGMQEDVGGRLNRVG